jgi:uncharacterized protein YjbJ (UPF0337 family)
LDGGEVDDLSDAPPVPLLPPELPSHANPAQVPGGTAGPPAAFPSSDQKGKNMDKDRIKGMGDQAKGAVKDATGKVLGDSKLQAEGKADKMKGKIENAVGGAKDTVRDAINK